MLEQILTSIFSLLSTPVYADDPPPLELPELIDIIYGIMGYIFPIGVVLAAAMIIMGGYMWIVSGGDPGRKQQAQGVLTWSIIGLVFLFIVRALLLVVGGFISG